MKMVSVLNTQNRAAQVLRSTFSCLRRLKHRKSSCFSCLSSKNYLCRACVVGPSYPVAHCEAKTNFSFSKKFEEFHQSYSRCSIIGTSSSEYFPSAKLNFCRTEWRLAPDFGQLGHQCSRTSRTRGLRTSPQVQAD